MVDEAPRLILVTGASGAGLSTALNILEDCGVKVVDNLPLAMIDTLVAMEVEAGGRSLAFGLDARTTGFSVGAVETLVRNLRRKFPDQFTAIYLAASQDDLLRRFNATRRQHPLAAAGTLADAIAADLDRMDDISPLADIRLDTSSTKPLIFVGRCWPASGLKIPSRSACAFSAFPIAGAFPTTAIWSLICALPRIRTGSRSCVRRTGGMRLLPGF